MTCQSDLATILITGAFSGMSQEWLMDGTCNIVVQAKNGRVYTALVSHLFEPIMVFISCTDHGGALK